MGDRDTDADWARIAATEPYFGVLSDNRFLSAHLDDAAREEFFASGRDYVASALRSAAPFLAGRRIRNALDFGCGVGRLLLPIAETSEQAFGIDIAPGMRELARGNAENAHLTNVTLCASVDELPANVTFDWINSYIVFQHIPPTRGYAILENLLKRLSVGGVVSLQFSIARDRRLLEDSTNRLRLYRIDDGAMTPLLVAPDDGAARMSMFDYDLNVLLPILHQHGIENLFLHHDIVNGHYGISLTGGRVRSSQGG